MDSFTLPAPFDAHVHLRQGNLMRLVTPHVEQGGIRMAFVMVRPSLLLLLPPTFLPEADRVAIPRSFRRRMYYPHHSPTWSRP